jgi:predicted glycosyltransferase
MKPTLLFYCQHSLGLGHLARSLRVAAALTRHFDVVLLNGGRFPEGTRLPDGVQVVNLPPLGHDESYKLVTHDAELDVETAKKRRREVIVDAVRALRPEALLVEMYPFGRKKFEFELVPLLDAATALDRRPVIVCSLRDILVTGRRDQAAFDERASVRVNRWFDAVLMHADPAFAQLEDSFRPATPLAVPVHYTGFVAPGAPASSDAGVARLPRMLVSSGGGMVGEPLVRAAVQAHQVVHERTGLATTVVAGPFLPDAVWAFLEGAAAASPLLEAVRTVPDLAAEMRRSAVSLSQGGYNTTMDILRARVPAVVVPFSEGAEDEQRRRTERLAAMGVIRWVAPHDLTTERIVAETDAVLRTPPSPVELDLDGADNAAATIAELVAERHGAGVTA